MDYLIGIQRFKVQFGTMISWTGSLNIMAKMEWEMFLKYYENYVQLVEHISWREQTDKSPTKMEASRQATFARVFSVTKHTMLKVNTSKRFHE